MKFDEIRPVVYALTPRKYMPDARRMARAKRCELLLVREGGGEIRAGSRRVVPVGPGSLLLVPPDGVYTVRAAEKPLSGLSVSFDYAPSGGDGIFEDAVCLNEPLVLNDMQGLDGILSRMLKVYVRKEPYWQMRVSAGLQDMLTYVAQSAQNRMHGLISQVIDVVSARYMEPLNNSDIASALGYHPNYVNAVFVRDMGMSMHQYLMRYRVEMATHLLMTTQLPISDIAEKVGFRHFSHFSNCFHRLTGLTPAAYRLER